MEYCSYMYVLLDDLILGLYYSNFTKETGGFELALITHELQADRLNTCARSSVRFFAEY